MTLLVAYRDWNIHIPVPNQLKPIFPDLQNVCSFNLIFEFYELLTNSILAEKFVLRALDALTDTKKEIESKPVHVGEKEIFLKLLVHLMSNELKLSSSETLAQIIISDYENYPIRFDLIFRYLQNHNNSNVFRKFKRVIGTCGCREMQKIVKFLYFGTINKLVSESQIEKAKKAVMKYLITRPKMLDAVLSAFAPIDSFAKTLSVIHGPVLDAAASAPKEDPNPPFFNAQDFLHLYRAASLALLTETLGCLFQQKFYPLLQEVFPLLDSSIKVAIKLQNVNTLEVLLDPKIYLFNKLSIDDSIMDSLLVLRGKLKAAEYDASDELLDDGSDEVIEDDGVEKQSDEFSKWNLASKDKSATLESIIINLLELPLKITIKQLDSLIVSDASANLIKAFATVLSKQFNVLNQSIILKLNDTGKYILSQARKNLQLKKKLPIYKIDESVLIIALKHNPDFIPFLLSSKFVPSLIDVSYNSYEALILAIQMDSQEFIQAFYSFMHLSVVRDSIHDPFVRVKLEQKASKLTKEVIMHAFHRYDNKQRVNANKDLASQ